jgi:hypothetical protein
MRTNQQRLANVSFIEGGLDLDESQTVAFDSHIHKVTQQIEMH